MSLQGGTLERNIAIVNVIRNTRSQNGLPCGHVAHFVIMSDKNGSCRKNQDKKQKKEQMP